MYTVQCYCIIYHCAFFGYGFSAQRHLRLLFTGDESKYELWEIRFLGHMRNLKLHDTVVNGGDADEEVQAYSEIVQLLDDRSLSVVIRDANNVGRKALKILRDHYQGKSKPRVISLYTQLTSLTKSSNESVTDYIIRSEKASDALKNAGENVSDYLLIAMVLKGLPPQYNAFKNGNITNGTSDKVVRL